MIRNRNYKRKKIKSSQAWKLSGRIALICFFSNLYTTDLWAQLSVDVQYRNRLEVRDGYQKLAEEGTAPAVFVSQRTRISFSYEAEGLRLRITPQDTRVWGDEQQTSSTGVFGDNASLDLFEAWAGIRTGKDGWLYVGRQPLVYDNERLLSARNWNQNGMTYDAAVFKWETESLKLHAGSSWNSTGENTSNNHFDPDYIKSLSFLWAQHNPARDWKLSFLHIASGVTETDTTNTIHFRQTTGLYSVLKKNSWQIWADLYYQYGKNKTGKNVSAVLFDAEVIFQEGKLVPSVGVSYLSGNRKTGSDQGTDHLFDVLYGTRHRFFGMIDYFRSFSSNTKQGGLADYYFSLDYRFSTKTSLKNTAHYFMLAQNNPSTPDNKKLGYENDLVFKHQFSSWGGMEAGYAFFLPTTTLKTIQNVDHEKFSQFLYLQLTISTAVFKQSKSL